MSKWVRLPAPTDKSYGNGWCGQLDKCWRKGNKYVAMSRKIQTAWGPVEHVCIRNQSSTDISWAEKQAIKNDLFGRSAVAIEVYPAVDRLVDAANMYHLWVLPEGFILPFGLHDNDEQGEAIYR